MAQSDRPPQEPTSTAENVNNPSSLWRRLFGRDSTASGMPDSPPKEQGSQSDDDPKRGLIRRVSRKVVPGLPRAQTFKRQQSEIRNKLEPVQPTPAERRAVSVDRRLQTPQTGSHTQSNPRSSAPDFTNQSLSGMPSVPSVPSFPASSLEEKMVAGTANPEPPVDGPNFHDGLYDGDGHSYFPDGISTADCHSMTTSQYDALIHEELERTWILNLSMHFRDKSKREKFFVTYRERPTLWRRVTISIDYRNAPDNSLELELSHIKFQRDKIAKIYDAIRESLVDIQFYSTVTNLKLQTTDGRLHVHVVEDVNEIIHYPSVRTIQHMRCNRVKERDIEFDSHISGFVYKVRVNDEVLIKKEIPGPDTVDEFLYEINALNRLKHSNHVISFYGVIVDDNEEHVKGLLISHAEQGALIDIIYDQIHPLPWRTRERWARQIVAGLSDIHEAGFVQGDFTLSNIVVDDDDNAKIIDINRRGCPVGWEPPEATPLIESNQRISMYIGVKSDLYQLGMVLWALAMKEDEPEAHGRPLHIGSDVHDVPNWFRRVVDICLSEDPRGRMSALQLLSIFPDPEPESDVGGWYDHPSISVDDGVTRKEYFLDADPTAANGYPRVRTAQPTSDWSYVGWGHSYVGSPNGLNDEPFFYPVTRGRSPPSPLPSNPGEYDSSRYGYRTAAWVSTPGSARTEPSECDAEVEEKMEEGKKSVTPRRSQRSVSDAGGITGADHTQVPEPAEDRPPQLDSKTAADVPDVDGQLNNTLDPRELQVSSRPQTSQQQQQTAGPGTPDEVPETIPQEVSKGTEVCEVRSCVEHACVQQMKGEGDDPPETGHTEPTLPEEIGGGSPTLEARDLRSGPDGTNTQASVTAVMSIDQPWGELEIAPETVKLPDSGTPSERTQDGVQAATLSDESEKTFQKSMMTADNTQTDPSHEMSQSTPQHNETCGIPDELKGVGSTCETGPENLHQSMTGHDIAILIDAEMAAGAKE